VRGERQLKSKTVWDLRRPDAKLDRLAREEIDLLDVVEPDPDAEDDAPAEPIGDDEPSLGWSITGATGTLDASPFLSDLEEEHDGREQGDAEPWRVPARLDVLPRGVFIGRRP
jgi:hypothetical protein